MTIDEEIVFERKLAEYYKKNHLKNEAREHEQRAEWLEELKMLRELKDEHRKIGNIEGFNQGYRKAIDDLSNKICMHFADWKYSEDDKCIKDIIELASESVEEIAEQLKAGVRNENYNKEES
ncbi:MAG: hypothetical protein MR304_09375 [Eubacterium sp.]|nr:hypothetical protein [Eubacterium sp.]